MFALIHLRPASRCQSSTTRSRQCRPRRCYAQQRVARTPQSLPQQSTSKPSPTARVKNRSSVGTSGTSKASSNASKVSSQSASPISFERGAAEMFQKNKIMDEMKGMDALVATILGGQGVDPWAQKFPLMDLRIPKSLGDSVRSTKNPLSIFSALGENMRNQWQNMLSMYRMGSEFAFPGRVTKRLLSPQIFMANSVKPSAWIAPVRNELLSVYKQMNEAIASGDDKALKRITAYEFQSRALSLVRKRFQQGNKGAPSDRHYVWKLHSEVEQCRVLSIRAIPGHYGSAEPKTGNRLIVQLLARFETMQNLEVHNTRGERLRTDGNVASHTDPPPEPKRVLEYIVFENKMWYPHGWIIRDQMYEGVQSTYRDAE